MDTIAIVIIVISVVFVLLFPIYQPFGMVLANMIASGCFFIYKKLHYSQYETVDKRTFWRGPLRIYARMWNFFGRVYHGYEMIGIEKIPTQGPALLIIYHGYLPLDGFFILSKILLDLDRKVVTIVEKLNDKIPCYKTFTEAVEHSSGTIEWCVETLQNGDLLAIYPGGTREAFLTDTYEIIWRDNAGFAKVALQTNAPIIPIFTQNVRDFMLVFKVFTNYFKKLYLKYRIGFRLFYGWWPIKMKSIVGDPVQYEPTDSVEEVVRKTKEAMQKLINENQRVPNNLFRSLLDRF